MTYARIHTRDKGSDYGGFRTPYPQKIFLPRRGVSFKRTEAGFTSRDNICGVSGRSGRYASRAVSGRSGRCAADIISRGELRRFQTSGVPPQIARCGRFAADIISRGESASDCFGAQKSPETTFSAILGAIVGVGRWLYPPGVSAALRRFFDVVHHHRW